MRARRATLLVGCVALLSACHPHDVRRVEPTPQGFQVHVSAQCGSRGLQALFERVSRDACKGAYRVVSERIRGHMWGSLVGECVVREREAEIECVKDPHP